MLAAGWLHLQGEGASHSGPHLSLVWMGAGGPDPFPFPDCMTGMGVKASWLGRHGLQTTP